ncbi:RHS repeat-associated core domain-containing protein [Bradymonas sediminis]|uniref:RHS repeat-associated core domain-containing protein n=1 Tax=Bradymonas sediminis TaxID=1548548 RepID=UPI0013A6F1F7|nr:RHS repeat-associated core domain-containing protein [Bradymonas sediminis]
MGAWDETLRVSELDAPTHQFVGFEPDPATGWYFMGARVYDPELRRWLSPDPLLLAAPELGSGEGIELNLYSYAGNNPIVYTDPDGTCRRNGAKVDCFSAAWEAYQAITATTQQSLDQGNYGDAAAGMVLGTAQTVNVGAGFVAQGFADIWNAGVDAKGGNYTPLVMTVGMAVVPGGQVGKVAKGVNTTVSRSVKRRSKTVSQLPTPPTLPPKSVAKSGDIEIIHYTKSGDHGPAHMHVKGGGKEVRIGQNGRV